MAIVSIPIKEMLDKAPSFTINELSAMYGAKYQTIRYMLMRHNVRPKSGHFVKQRLTKEVLEKVFEEPRTLQEAANILNTSASQVRAALIRHGIIRSNNRGVRSNFKNARVVKVLACLIKNPEKSNVEIGKAFSCSREYVRQLKDAAINEGLITQ